MMSAGSSEEGVCDGLGATAASTGASAVLGAG